MPAYRRSGRTLFLWDANEMGDWQPFGGLQVTAGMTHHDLFGMLSVLLITTGPIVVHSGEGVEISDDEAADLHPGDYIVSADGLEINSEAVFTRATSITTGARVRSFLEAVQQRDGGCVITRTENLDAMYGNWAGFEAAHIFPLAYEQQWLEGDYGRWISIVPERGGHINSVQNGLLMRSDLHQHFDQYLFSVNPDNGYKIIAFSRNLGFIAGQTLPKELLDDARCPPDPILRWHFRQAVLTNMRGAGEPIYDHYFPENSDSMQTILEGPNPQGRMEFELSSRLAAHIGITNENKMQMLPADPDEAGPKTNERPLNSRNAPDVKDEENKQ